uniref:Uncharacterized protein n=1 Tax=Anguilla anguilla TaxID=7936 RepID=A0A0E9PVI2_ANGAN
MRHKKYNKQTGAVPPGVQRGVLYKLINELWDKGGGSLKYMRIPVY